MQLTTSLQQHSALVFLQHYSTPQAAQAASREQLTQVLREAGHTTAEKVAPKVYETLHQPHLSADDVTTRTKARLIQALVAQLMPLLEQIAAYDKEMTELFLTHANSQIFASLPGAGKRLAPDGTAEWGDDRKRYADPSSIQALAGTSPVPFESGNYAKVHQRLACLKPLRNALQQFAWLSTQQEAWARDYYDRKRREGKSHRMAVLALANVWVRIIFAMWHKREAYQRAVFETAQRAHARRVVYPPSPFTSRTDLEVKGKTAIFMPFYQACLFQTTQAQPGQGKRRAAERLDLASGVVHFLMPEESWSLLHDHPWLLFTCGPGLLLSSDFVRDYVLHENVLEAKATTRNETLTLCRLCGWCRA